MIFFSQPAPARPAVFLRNTQLRNWGQAPFPRAPFPADATGNATGDRHHFHEILGFLSKVAVLKQKFDMNRENGACPQLHTARKSFSSRIRKWCLSPVAQLRVAIRKKEEYNQNRTNCPR